MSRAGRDARKGRRRTGKLRIVLSECMQAACFDMSVRRSLDDVGARRLWLPFGRVAAALHACRTAMLFRSTPSQYPCLSTPVCLSSLQVHVKTGCSGTIMHVRHLLTVYRTVMLVAGHIAKVLSPRVAVLDSS